MAAGDANLRTLNALLIGDDAGTFRRLGATLGGALHGILHQGLTNQRDATLNDSNKAFTVPANRIWVLHTVYVVLVATATVGNRRIVTEIRDTTGNISGGWPASATTGAAATRGDVFSPSIGGTATAQANYRQALFPYPIVLPAAWNVHVFDVIAVDPTADDMTVTLLYDEYTV